MTNPTNKPDAPHRNEQSQRPATPTQAQSRIDTGRPGDRQDHDWTRYTPCEYPACNLYAYQRYCERHGTIQSRWQELRPQFQPKEDPPP